MNASTQIIPLGAEQEIDEVREFRKLEAKVEARRFISTQKQFKNWEASERKIREEERRERRAERNFKLMGLGAVALGSCTAGVWTAIHSHGILALFPFALMALVLLIGAIEDD